MSVKQIVREIRVGGICKSQRGTASPKVSFVDYAKFRV